MGLGVSEKGIWERRNFELWLLFCDVDCPLQFHFSESHQTIENGRVVFSLLVFFLVLSPFSNAVYTVYLGCSIKKSNRVQSLLKS